MKVAIDTLNNLPEKHKLRHTIYRGVDEKAEIRVFGTIDGQQVAFKIIEPEIKMGERYFVTFGEAGSSEYQEWWIDLNIPETRQITILAALNSVRDAAIEFNKAVDISSDKFSGDTEYSLGEQKIKFVSSQDELFYLGVHFGVSFAHDYAYNSWYKELIEGNVKIGVVYADDSTGFFTLARNSIDDHYALISIAGIEGGGVNS